MKRVNTLILLGVVLVVVGVGLAWAAGRDDDGDASERAVATVLVATAGIEPGQAGDELVAAGRVRTERVDAGDVEPGALTSTHELAGTIVGAAVAEGEQVTAAALRSSALRGDALSLPDGHVALAVTVPFTAGVAGYVGAGDRVDVYASILPGAQGAPTSPRTELLLAGVEVLDVSDEVTPRRAEPVATVDGTPGTTPARAEGEEITLLLAVEPVEAEQVVFAATNDQLWFALAGEDAEPPQTPGVDYSTYAPAGDR